MPKKPKLSKFKGVLYKKKSLLVQKKKNFGAKFINNTVVSAIVAWNTGRQYPTKMLNALQLEVFPYTKRAIVAKGSKRIYFAQPMTPSTQPNRK